MAGRHKRFRHFRRQAKIKERWESKPHPTSFICYGRPAYTAAHLTGKNSFIDGLFTAIEFQTVHSPGYPDILLVENSCPLHWRPMKALACLAMADFCVYRIRTHLNLNSLAVTVCPVFGDKARIRDRRIFWSQIFNPSIFQKNHLISSTNLYHRQRCIFLP